MKLFTDISKAISFVFSPIVIPTYSVALLLSVTELALIPFSTRLITVAVIFGLTGVLPLIFIALLRLMGLVDNMSLTRRPDRFWPYLTTVVCYSMAIGYFYLVNAPRWLIGFMIGATLALVVVALVNNLWKISAHATAMGGLLALVTSLSMHAVYTQAALVMMTVVLAIAGLVGVARLMIAAHNPLQLYAGYANGFVWVFLAMTL